MILRWLHKSWKYLWGIILSVLLVILIVVGSVIGLLQLDITQDYLLDRIKNRVEQEYNARLSVGDLGGFLPFNVQLEDVVLASRDSVKTDTLARIGSLENKIDIWQLLQNKVSITGFVVNEPEFWLRKGENGKITFLERVHPRDTTDTADEPWLNNVEVLAPSMEISGGVLHLQNMRDTTQMVSLPPSVTISNLNANLFLEWTEQQRYLDIESISAETDLRNLRQFSMTGQVYSDQRFLEFNSFYFHIGNSELTLNGEIDGVDLGKSNFLDQFLSAHYDLQMISTALYPQELREIIPSAPDMEGPFTFQLYTEGSTNSLQVNEISIGRGESLFRLNGLFQNLQQPDAFSYRVSIDSVNLRREDIRPLLDTLQTSQYQSLEDLTMKGTANGSLDSINVDLAITSPLGLLNVQGSSQLKAPHQYQGTMDGRNMDVSWLVPTVFDTTALNFGGQLAGSGLTLEDAISDFEITFENSRVDQQTFDRLQLTSSLYSGRWNHQYNYRNGEQMITGSGTVDFSRERPPIVMEGKAENIDLAELAGDTSVASTNLNFDYNVDIAGLDPNSVQGRASFDVAPSVINGDSVQAHQFYADINTEDNQQRIFRLTSSLFDMHVEGDIYPDEIIRQSRFWSAYLKGRYQSEIKIDSTARVFNPMPPPSRNIVLDGSMRAKNLSLIKKYLPKFPSVYTDSRITFNVNSNQDRLLLSTEMQADTVRYDQWSIRENQTQLTASFRSDEPLRESASVDLKTDIGTLHSSRFDMDSVGVAFAFKQDSLHYRQRIKNIGENARFNLELGGGISDSSIVASVKDFYLGNDTYAWTNQGTPILNFMEQQRVVFTDFSFENRDEYFQLQGALSDSQEDSLSYTLRDINLARISELVKGEINFGGILNGRLMTRSQLDQPTIQGALDVNRLTLNDRIVGDVSFNSSYNQPEDRFDTRIEVLTDPEKYADYLETNDGVRQHFVLDGYFSTSESAAQDSIFYFDADFKQIDMWLVPLIVDNIFQQMEGEAVGEGYISGNFDDFNFHADFETQGVFAKPRFINTNYFINGTVTLDRQDGVILDSLSVMDTKGGTGTLWGTIDLNDFEPLTYLDLSLAMNRLQFLNSSMDPDVPFFGNISGTGTIRLSGSNIDMYMRTENPVQLTNSSRLSIPLLEETELNETGQFIRFVDSFEDRGRSPGEQPAGDGTDDAREEAFREAIQDLTFSERFDLDLRFNTDRDIAVNLIFDPVTGDELNARGAGQMRISMQNQEVQMFGQYRVNSGTYQFVTGEIISRRLDLQPGGTIAWEGPPDNARLDLSAIYHARPNISTLTAEGAIESQNQSRSQQVPVDLIVDITGTLNSVENSYYFQLPSSLDISSDPTLSYTINQINRDEQQKLLQATSILFTGQFIPTQGAGSPTASLSQSLTRGSTVLNPLLSNQVISPLLSNQINALLNSDVSRMDIDFNLNAYNEVDLGIALRLYNDRLILRREGQLTGGGPQTTLGDRIGDLNATYRINRRLSLTAFHRRNQILSSFGAQSQAGDVTPSVDGVGLETQFRFNTWQELWNKIWGISPGTDARKEESSPDTSATEEESEEK